MSSNIEKLMWQELQEVLKQDDIPAHAISVSDIMEQLDCSKHQARNYLEDCVTDGTWVKGVRRNRHYYWREGKD